jgi:hypothetical protein
MMMIVKEPAIMASLTQCSLDCLKFHTADFTALRAADAFSWPALEIRAGKALYAADRLRWREHGREALPDCARSAPRRVSHIDEN